MREETEERRGERETYPGADLSQVPAVHLLGAGHVGKGDVDVLVLAGEHLVAQTLLAASVAQLEGGLDPVKVGELGPLLGGGLQHVVDDVVGVDESPGQRLGGDPAVSFGHSDRTEMAGG